MKKKLMALMFTLSLSLTVLSVPTLANNNNDNYGPDVQNNNDGTRIMETNAAGDDDGFDWEWIGLLGLLGLLGLRRRDERNA